MKEDIESAVYEIHKSGLLLWALVNNAGFGYGGPWDWGHDVDDLKFLLEVNTYGPVRLSKACIAMLRKTGGRIVNVSSAAGRCYSRIHSWNKSAPSVG